jgi:uncharacterized membrane protein (DUF2068 family)
VAETRAARKSPTHRALAWIAVFKLFKAITLLALAAAALHLLAPGALDRQVGRLRELPLASGWRPMVHFIDWLTAATPHNIELVAGLACAYALLYATEGVGLWLQKRWAEYLTTLATASLIPFEIWELTRGATALKIAALAINVAIVVYLCYVIRSDRRQH